MVVWHVHLRGHHKQISLPILHPNATSRFRCTRGIEDKEIDELGVTITEGTVWLRNTFMEWVAAKGLSKNYKRIKAHRHVCRVSSIYMEHNDVENHIYFKGNVQEIYNMKGNLIIQLGDILCEIQEIYDDNEPEK